LNTSVTSPPPASGGGAPGIASRGYVWAALATVYLIWGSTYLAIRVMVETIPPLLGAGLRFALAGSLLLAWLMARGGRSAVRVPRRSLAATAVAGALLLFGGNGLVTVAERHFPSALAALVIASVPLWVVVLRAVTGEHVPRTTLAGVLLGFGGVALLLVPGGRPEGADGASALVLVLAAACWAGGAFASTKLPLPDDLLVSAAWQQLLAGGAMVLAGILAGEGDRLAGLSADSLWALAYLTVAGSLLAFTAFAWLLRHAPISLVATYAYVNPVVAIALGAAILGERLTATTGIGAAIIVASVAAVVAARRPTPEGAPA
jgi:drug/metabolite transporter (DMT)-like permease